MNGNTTLSDNLVDPDSCEHTMLLYDDEQKGFDIITKYVNEGLKQNQLCVYGVINKNKAIKKISSQIENYEENIKKENLLLIELKEFYIAALDNDLTPFANMNEDLTNRIKDKTNKHIRYIGDLGSFLLKNKHFDQCMSLEQRRQNKPFGGSWVCSYPESIFSEYPFSEYKERLFHMHDKVVFRH